MVVHGFGRVAALMIGMAAILAGCASRPHTPSLTLDEAVWQDRHYQYPASTSRIVPADAIFALPMETEQQLKLFVAREANMGRRFALLMRTIFGKESSEFPYLGTRTTTAAETLHNHGGNCISLAIMTVALAERLGFEAHIQEVARGVMWEHREGLNFRSRHINVLIRRPANGTFGEIDFSSDIVIDFEPQRGLQRQAAKLIDRDTVIAMFYSNLAAEAMTRNDAPLAYANLRMATSVQPRYEGSWVNLSQLYGLSKRAEPAERALAQALAVAPDSYPALAAMSRLLKKTGRTEQAAEFDARISARRARDPFYLFELGQQQIAAGNYAAARESLEQAQDLIVGFRELHEALLGVYTALGLEPAVQQQRDRLAGLATSVPTHVASKSLVPVL